MEKNVKKLAKIGEKDAIEEVEDGAKKGTLTWKREKLEEREEIQVTFKVVGLTEERLKVIEVRNQTYQIHLI